MTLISFAKHGSVRSEQPRMAEAMGLSLGGTTAFDIRTGGDVLVPYFNRTSLPENVD